MPAEVKSATVQSREKHAPANRSRSPAVISGQAVATGERIARAAATKMRWQLTFMAREATASIA
jgi:hypothetical protein